MSRQLEIVTPEHVAIRYELAGFGSRGAAVVVDTLVLAGIYLVLGLLTLWVLSLLNLLHSWESLGEESFWQQFNNSLVISVAILVVFAVSWGYFIAFEALWNGETPGKRLLGLRVIRDGGYPVDFRAVVIRNLLRAIDSMPAPSYGLAFLTSLFNPQYKRLGDMAAGTLVVRHGREQAPTLPSEQGGAVVYRLLDAATLAQIGRLQREEYRAVQRFLERRSALPLALRAQFAERLAAPLISKLQYQPPALGMDPERWLEELDLAYRVRALGTQAAAPAASMPVSPTPTPVPETPPVPGEPGDRRKW